MFANTRENRTRTLLRCDLHPPHTGPGADPVLYGVAAALETLFPPVPLNAQETAPAKNAGAADEDGEPGGS